MPAPPAKLGVFPALVARADMLALRLPASCDRACEMMLSARLALLACLGLPAPALNWYGKFGCRDEHCTNPAANYEQLIPMKVCLNWTWPRSYHTMNGRVYQVWWEDSDCTHILKNSATNRTEENTSFEVMPDQCEAAKEWQNHDFRQYRVFSVLHGG